MPGVRVHAFPDVDSCVRQLASDLACALRQALQQQAQVQLLLPGGSSPQRLLPQLAVQPLAWERVRLSPTDERWVAAEAPQSNLRLLREGLPQANWLDPRQAPDPALAARHWGQRLAQGLPHAAVLLGMGEDGHFASLFPGMPGLAAALDLRQPPAALVGEAPTAPYSRLSLNLSLLLATRWLGLLAFGAGKRELLDRLLAQAAESAAWPLQALFAQDQVTLQVYWAP